MTARIIFEIDFTGPLTIGARARLADSVGLLLADDADEWSDTPGMARIGESAFMLLTWEGKDGPQWRITAATHNPEPGRDDQEAEQLENTLYKTLQTIPDIHNVHVRSRSSSGISHEQRKSVTVLFADVAVSTGIASTEDREDRRTRLIRYHSRVNEIASSHGGTVERFAGDAAIIVFGLSGVHDDVAERAVRAAFEIQQGVPGMAVRVGIHTGEIVAAAAEEHHYLLAGDAVEVAARLQQGARPGEVVVSRSTERLTHGVISYERHASIKAKGNAEGLTAFRAVSPRTD